MVGRFQRFAFSIIVSATNKNAVPDDRHHKKNE